MNTKPMLSGPLPVPDPSVIFQHVDDGAILLSPADEVYYGLNRVGAWIWEQMSKHRTFESLLEALGSEYPEAKAATLHADLTELVRDLESHELLRTSEADA